MGNEGIKGIEIIKQMTRIIIAKETEFNLSMQKAAPGDGAALVSISSSASGTIFSHVHST